MPTDMFDLPHNDIDLFLCDCLEQAFLGAHHSIATTTTARHTGAGRGVVVVVATRHEAGGGHADRLALHRVGRFWPLLGTWLADADGLKPAGSAAQAAGRRG